jgi:hypothetical protein
MVSVKRESDRFEHQGDLLGGGKHEVYSHCFPVSDPTRPPFGTRTRLRWVIYSTKSATGSGKNILEGDGR